MHGRLAVAAALICAAVLLPGHDAHASAGTADQPAQRSPALVDAPRAQPPLIRIPPLPKSALRRLVARPSRTFAALDVPDLGSLPRIRTITVRSTRIARRLHDMATTRPEDWTAVCMNLTIRKLYREVQAAAERELWRSGQLPTPERVEGVILVAGYTLLKEGATSVVPFGTYVEVFQAVKELTDGDVSALFDLVCA